MEQYDKIGVPLFPEALPQHQSFKTITGPVIVLTIEEALEIWNAGRHRASDEIGSENLSKVTAADFYNYMASKGLTIKQQ